MSCDHPKTPENLYRRPTGRAECRPCKTALEMRRRGYGGQKRCSACQVNKDYTEFPRNRTRRDGRANVCSLCQNTSRQGTPDKLPEAEVQRLRAMVSREWRRWAS